MTYLAVLIIGATLGAWADRWWGNYLADSDDHSIRDDRRSMERHSRASQAINLRRWE